MRSILTTVGTSLRTNATRHLSLSDVHDQHLAAYLRDTRAEQASAETNSLSRLLQQGDRIILVYSDTPEGQQCALALQRWYTTQGFSADVIVVTHLTYTEHRFKMRGLRSLVATLIDLIRRERRQGREVLLNATGGFKAEIAYATLVGLLFDVPVYYIHEAFRDIIAMPSTPISWDYTLLADYEEFFTWVHADLRPSAEVQTRIRGLPQEIGFLLTEEEDFTILSPAGEALYEAYYDRLASMEHLPILLSSQARTAYGAATPDVRRLFDRALTKLRVRILRISGADRVCNCDCLVYPKGHRDERVFFFEGEDGNVCVCALARHSDRSYEQLIARGVRRESYTDFAPWVSTSE